VLSSGHGALGIVIESPYTLPHTAMLLGLKAVGSAISLGSGFRGGLFFCSLFLGALTGKLFAGVLAMVTTAHAVPAVVCCLVGMSAMAVAIIGGPLTMGFLALESTGSLPLTTAVLAACVVSALTVRRTFGYSFATWRFHLRGEAIRSAVDIGWMRNLTVGRMMRREMRTVTERIDGAFKHDAGRGAFNRDDGNRLVGRGIGVGPAHHAQHIGAFAVPSGGRRNPFFPAVDDPVVALEFRRGAHALTRRRRSRVGAAARFARTKSRQRRTALRQEWREQPATLLRRAAEQNRQDTENRSQHRQADAGVHAVELFGHDRHVDQTLVFATRRSGNAFSQKSRRDHGFIDGPGGEKPLLRGRQLFGLPCACKYVPGEPAGLELQLALLRCKREVDCHRTVPKQVWRVSRSKRRLPDGGGKVLDCSARFLGLP
jgi:hypothetical protein